MSVQVDTWWAPLDLSRLCRSFAGRTGVNATDRLQARSAAFHALYRSINHIAFHSPRLVFSVSHPYAFLPQEAYSGQVNIYRYRVYDHYPNERTRIFRMLHQYRTADPGSQTDAYAQPLDNAFALETNAAGAPYQGSWASSKLEPSGPDSLVFGRGDAPNSERNEGMAVFNRYTPISVSVQGEVQPVPDVSYTYCAQPPTSGSDVIAGYLEHLRSVFHTIRSTYSRNVVMWYAAQKSGGWDTTMTADSATQWGAKVTSTSFINVLDFTSTSRTATSPGWSSHVYRHGRGDQANTTHGKKLRVACRVLANATTADGTVRFIGPASIASNQTDITVTAGAALGWWGGANYVYLDTSVDNDDVSTSRAKIDIHVKAGASGTLYVYGLQAFTYYE